MRKIFVIAVREYQAVVRTKMFVVSLILMPVLGGGGAIAHYLLRDQVDITEKKVAVVDWSGALFPALQAAAKEREKTLFNPETQQQVRPRFDFENVPPQPDDPAAQRLALADKVRDTTYFAIIDIPADVLTPTKDPDDARIAYYSNNPTYDELENFIQQPLNNAIHAIRLDRAGIDKTIVDEATRYVPVRSLGLPSRDVHTGEVTQAEEVNKVAYFIVPMVFMFLMFMVIAVGATPLMQGVLEEKMQRIAEVLLGSVTPFQLMAGKLIGTVGVSLTLLILYLVWGVALAEWAGYGDFIPRHLIKWFVIYQVLAVFMFGSMFSAIGAACSDLKEAQSAFLPVWLIVCIPLFIWFQVVREPSSTFSTVASLFPPATPTLMIIRQAVPPGPPFWQPYLGVGLMLVTTVLCVFASGRIFRVGLLMQGKGANLRQMFRWALTG